MFPPTGEGVAGVHVEAVGAAVDLGDADVDQFDECAIESRLGDGVADGDCDGDLCAVDGAVLLVDRDAGGVAGVIVGSPASRRGGRSCGVCVGISLRRGTPGRCVLRWRRRRRVRIPRVGRQGRGRRSRDRPRCGRTLAGCRRRSGCGAVLGEADDGVAVAQFVAVPVRRMGDGDVRKARVGSVGAHRVSFLRRTVQFTLTELIDYATILRSPLAAGEAHRESHVSRNGHRIWKRGNVVQA